MTQYGKGEMRMIVRITVDRRQKRKMSMLVGSLTGDREKTNEPAHGLIDRRERERERKDK